MRLCPFALVLFCALLLSIPSIASEYPQDKSYPTKEEIRSIAEQVSDLRKSFTEGWLRTISIILSGLTVLITFGIFIAGVGAYVSLARIKELSEQAEIYARSAKAHADEAEEHKAIIFSQHRPGPRRSGPLWGPKP